MAPFPQLSEPHYQTIFDQSPFGILVFDSSGNCLGANQGWENIWQQSRDTLSTYNILKDPRAGNPAALEAIHAAFQGQAREIPTTYFDPKLSGGTGRPRHVQGFAFPIKDAAGTVCQVVITFMDVTTQEQMKKDLADSRDFSTAISRLAPTIIAVFDVTTGEYLHLSDAFEKLLGYPVEEARKGGYPFMMSITHPEDLKRILAKHEGALRELDTAPGTFEGSENPVVPFEYRIRAKDGSWKSLRTLGSIFQRDEAGKVKTVINASLDVTELKEAIRFRDEFLAIASHELKTPLTPLKLQVDLLTSVLDSGDLSAIPTQDLKKLLYVAGHQIDRLSGLVNNLLDVSRLTIGKLELKREIADLGAFVEALVEGHRPQVASQGCTLVLHAPTGIRLAFDPIRVSQVISNVVCNSIHHSGTKVIEVRVEAIPDRNQARVIVRDEGKGIEPENRERIFERFERSDSQRGAGGLGLGLFIARQIARAHGGELRLADAPPPGATFVLELPLEGGPRS